MANSEDAFLEKLMGMKNYDPNGNIIDTNRPILKNDDGSFSTERSITIQHGNLNNGKPTNIPTIWNGKELDPDSAIKMAVQSRQQFPSYRSINEAVTAAKTRSEHIGKIRGAEAESSEMGPIPQEEGFLEKLMKQREGTYYGQ